MMRDRPRALRAIAMGVRACALFLPFLTTQVLAQIPVLAADSARVDIRDGDLWLPGGWYCDPAQALDTYLARAGRAPRRIAFITDRDSMAFDLEPGRTVDFVILLAGRDSCHTRISTMRQGFTRTPQVARAGPVEIPIAIRHGKLYLQGSVDGSGPLDLIFDTGADIHVLYPPARRKGAAPERRADAGHAIEIAGLRWDHEPLIEIDRQADRADGIIGYPAFEHCVLEFDFGRMVMTAHDTLPAHAATFTRTAMPYVGSLTAVEATLVGGDAPAIGRFLLDTGASGTVNVFSAFAGTHGFPGPLVRLGTSTSRGVRGIAVRNETALLPELRIAGFVLRELPIHIGASAGGVTSSASGTLNMEVLRRFDLLLDYPNGQAYFRRTGRTDAAFDRPSRGLSWGLVLAVATAIATAWWSQHLLSARRTARVGPEGGGD